MNSNLLAMVKNIATSKKLVWTSTRDGDVRNIERDLNKGRKTINDTMVALENKFGAELDKYNYQEIKKTLERKQDK